MTQPWDARGVSSEKSATFQASEDKKHHSAISNLAILSQQWERLLFSTGGGINLLKSFWFLMSWTWKNGIATLTPIKASPGDLSLTVGYGTEPV